MSGVARRVGTWAVAIAFILVGTEIALRVLGFGPGHAPLNPDPLLHHVHPRDYSYLSYSRTGEYGGFQVSFDKQGLRTSERKKRGVAQADQADCRIAFMGDSFTEGSQVRFDASFVGLLSALTSCDVKNYGVASYSPIFYAIQWQNIVSSTRPSLVILQLFDNDVLTDAELAVTAKRDASGQLMALADPRDASVFDFIRRIYVLRVLRMVQQKFLWWLDDMRSGDKFEPPPELNPDISELSANLVLRLARDAKQSGADFVFFAVPSQRRLINFGPAPKGPEFSDKWKQWARMNAVPFIDMVAAFARESEEAKTAFFFRDGHFAEAGHAITARALCREIEIFRKGGNCAQLGRSR